MGYDPKRSVEKAVAKYIEKNTDGLKSNTDQKKQRGAPERKTEKKVLRWCRKNGFQIHVVEASIFDRTTGEMGEAKAEAGFSDLVGNTRQGLACYIELKAEGRRHNLSDTQREFLIRKIKSFCFAVVVDSDAVLETYWRGFVALDSPKDRMDYLMDCLPRRNNTKRRKAEKKKIEEFGF